MKCCGRQEDTSKWFNLCSCACLCESTTSATRAYVPWSCIHVYPHSVCRLLWLYCGARGLRASAHLSSCHTFCCFLYVVAVFVMIIFNLNSDNAENDLALLDVTIQPKHTWIHKTTASNHPKSQVQVQQRTIQILFSCSYQNHVRIPLVETQGVSFAQHTKIQDVTNIAMTLHFSSSQDYLLHKHEHVELIHHSMQRIHATTSHSPW